MRWRRCWSHNGMGSGRNCNTSCTGRVGAPNTTVGRMRWTLRTRRGWYKNSILRIQRHLVLTTRRLSREGTTLRRGVLLRTLLFGAFTQRLSFLFRTVYFSRRPYCPPLYCNPSFVL